MISTSLQDFSLQGEFAGFIRTREGKKRMVLRVDGEEMLLKVQRELRRELSGHLRPGVMIEVAGELRKELFMGESKRVVTRVRPVTGEATPCTIKVCAKKNCWRQGGKELWRALEGTVDQQDLADVVRLKAVGCLDECKHAPNLEAHGRIHRHCSPAEAVSLLPKSAAATSADSDENRARIPGESC